MDLPLIVALLLMLAFARMLGEVFERLRQPSMLGEIIAGVILGPSMLGWVGYTPDLAAISELAVLMLIIHAGLEIRVDEIRESLRGKKAWIAVLGFVIPLVCGVLLGFILGYGAMVATFLGLCIGITALPVSVRILMDLGRLNSEVGRHILSAAIFNDVAALLILGVLLGLGEASAADYSFGELLLDLVVRLGKLLFFVSVLLFSYRGLQWLNERYVRRQISDWRWLDFLRGKESMFALVMIFVLIFASLAELGGLHFVVGAFFGAMLVPQELIARKRMTGVISTTSTITMGFLAPIFFAGIGVEFNISSINNVALALSILVVSFASKIVGGFVAGRMVGYSKTKSLTIGIGLNARGVMELVIANIALQSGLIDLAFFSILVLMGMLTTLVTPLLLKGGFWLMDRRGEEC